MKQKIVSTASKVAYKASMVVIGIAIAFVLWIGYSVFVPTQVLEVEVPIPATPTEVKAGDVVNLSFNYCKTKDLDSYIKIDFLGNYVIPSLSTTRSFPVGCHNEILAISIPAGTPNGVYSVRLEIDYRVNALRTEHYIFDSVDIKVVNDTGYEIIDAVENDPKKLEEE